MTVSKLSEDPPRQVFVALCLMGVEFGLAVIRTVLLRDWSRPVPAVLAVLLVAVLAMIWLYGLYRRRNWVRWMTVIVCGGGCVLAPFDVARLDDSVQIVLYWLQFAVTVPVVVLLLLPGTHVWYTRAPLAPRSAGQPRG
jgi:hypothetical protein